MYLTSILHLEQILSLLVFILTLLVDVGITQAIFLIKLELCGYPRSCTTLLLQPRESLCIIYDEQWLNKEDTKQVRPVHMAIYMRTLEIGLYQRKPLSQTNNTV